MYEIERKFLVDTKKWHPSGKGTPIKQGYLLAGARKTVRVRIKGSQAFLTIKGKPEGIKRTEFEYEIPVNDAETMLKMIDGFTIEKMRFVEKYEGFNWEIDVFEGKNKGLVLAEVELENENQQPELPEWVTKEVSEDKRYFNYYLSKNPFLEWKQAD